MKARLAIGTGDKPLIVISPDGDAEAVILASMAKAGIKVVNLGWVMTGGGPSRFESVTIGAVNKEPHHESEQFRKLEPLKELARIKDKHGEHYEASLYRELDAARKVVEETEKMIRNSTIIGNNPDFWEALSAYHETVKEGP